MLLRWSDDGRRLIAVVLLFFVHLKLVTAPPSPPPPERHMIPAESVQELIEKLFKTYSKEAVLDMPTVIHMDVLVLKVKNTIEKEGIFECVIALMIEWYDRRMTWDPEEHGNLTFLSLTTEQVWLPDIAMTNSADHLYSISRDERFNVRVSHDGLFKYVPTGTAKTWCDLKLLTFPFDIQQCSLEFESWSLDSKTMTFDGKSELLVDSSFASTQFQLCDHKAVTYFHTYNFTGETFTRVRFDFMVKRKSTFYVINLIFPCATLSCIQLLTFLIPSTDTTADRIGFGTTNLLTLVVFQTIVTEEMPKTSDAVTALSKYIIALIVLSAVGIFESVIVERLLGRTLTPPPDCLMRVFKYVPVVLRETPAIRQQMVSRRLQDGTATPSTFVPNKDSNNKVHPDCVDKMQTNNKQNSRQLKAVLRAGLKGCCKCGSNIENSSNSCSNVVATVDGKARSDDLARRDSYHLAIAGGRLPHSLYLRNNSNGSFKTGCGVRMSSSMLSFQPSSLRSITGSVDSTDQMIGGAATATQEAEAAAEERRDSSHEKEDVQIISETILFDKIEEFEEDDKESFNNSNSSSSSGNSSRDCLPLMLNRVAKLLRQLLEEKQQPSTAANNSSDNNSECSNNNHKKPNSKENKGMMGEMGRFNSVGSNYRRHNNLSYMSPSLAASMWAEIAFKVDFLTLVICGTMVLVLPCAMFVPLVYIDAGICNTQQWQQ